MKVVAVNELDPTNYSCHVSVDFDVIVANTRIRTTDQGYSRVEVSNDMSPSESLSSDKKRMQEQINVLSKAAQLLANLDTSLEEDLSTTAVRIEAMLDQLKTRTAQLEASIHDISSRRDKCAQALMAIRRVMRGPDEPEIEPETFADRVLEHTEDPHVLQLFLAFGLEGPDRFAKFDQAREQLTEEQRETLDEEFDQCMANFLGRLEELTGIHAFDNPSSPVSDTDG